MRDAARKLLPVSWWRAPTGGETHSSPPVAAASRMPMRRALRYALIGAGTLAGIVAVCAGGGYFAIDRLVVVLKIEGTETGGRVLLVDRLPAGLEIENPRLVDGGDVKGLDWLERGRQPVHTEFRDDRLVAAYDFFAAANGESNGAGKAATVAYIVRAVTPGAFVHPAATVEDMYRPERHARTAAGRLTVAPTN